MIPTPVALAAQDISNHNALILAGGGMRVAWQAGVLQALHEADVVFSHADGTSGGTINLAMLLSGLTPQQMCERWSSLNPRDFVSLMPIKHYLKGMRIRAMGDADGIVQKVLPHLSIDVDKIRQAQGIVGTFNVCNFTRKTNEAIEHSAITLDYLVAGISLPIFMPSVQINGMTYFDSVWIKDANLTEAVKRGAEELWLVWCIGNSNQYQDGLFDQYVHMIEVSAAGKLNEELEWINELNQRIAAGDSPYGQTQAITLHVIKPLNPLPLDPDFYLNRIDAATLIDLGYADAKRYLQNKSSHGVPLTPEATQVLGSTGRGIMFRETMKGFFSMGVDDPETGVQQGKAHHTELTMHAAIHIPDIDAFINDPTHTGHINGHIDFTPFGLSIPSTHGQFRLFSPSGTEGLKYMVYELGFEMSGQAYFLAGKKHVRNGNVFQTWGATTTLYCHLHEGIDASGRVVGAGILHLGVADLGRLLLTLHARNTPSLGEKFKTIGQFFSFFTRELIDTYIKRQAK